MALNFKSKGLAVLELLSNIILTVLIHNLKTTWPIKISMPFLRSLDNLLKMHALVSEKALIILT